MTSSTGMFSTALEGRRDHHAIRFPVPQSSAYAKFDNPASRYAMVGVFVARPAGGARVAVTGAGQDGVHRHAGLEADVSGGGDGSGVAVDASDLISDVHASADYRAHLVGVMCKRAVAALA